MKLLERTIKSHLLYAMVVLLAAVPLFYFITRALCMQDVDEALMDRKKHVVAQLTMHDEMLSSLPWHEMNNEVVIYPAITPIQAKENNKLSYYKTVSEAKEPFREFHTYARVKGEIYPVILRISLIGTEDLIQGIVITATLLMFLILGGLLWINRMQSRRIWRPFYQALEQLRQFNLDKKPDLRFSDTRIDEFKDLQQAGKLLAERTYRTYLQQKEFTENAAHEMQTPLASMQAILEVMIQNEQLTAQQSVHLQGLQDIVIRISRLNKGLLLLAKIENNQYSDMTTVRPVALIKRILSRLDMQIRLKKIMVTEDYQDYIMEANPMLLDILLNNLLHNAVQHSPERGQISVNASPGRIEIANTGKTLPFPDEKLFHRFQTGEHGRSSTGNGLGLAIVSQICESHHYAISYQYKEGCHHFVVVY